MGPLLEHIDAHLPVTTLKALQVGGARVIILGQGIYSLLIDENSGDVLADLRTFKRNHVHGFTVLNEKESHQGTGHIRLLAWGDRSIRLLDLLCMKNKCPEKPDVSLVAASAEFLSPDWVLDGCAPSIKTESDSAYLVTAHNSILRLDIIDDDMSKYGRTIHLQQLVAGVKSILYSADIISISESRILVAAGTVFGEIIVWSCFLMENAKSSIHHFFTGHEGSIFGVQISPVIPNLHGTAPGRLLASCSDDRTVRIWEISDCENVSPHDPSAYSTDGFELKCTGFGMVGEENNLTSESCVASAFGHGSRIWGIKFIPIQTGNQNQLTLVSRGEDSHCLVWDLSWTHSTSQKSDFSLRSINSIRNHSGKHVWSLDAYGTESGASIYTGGADGAVKRFALEIQRSGEIACSNRNTRENASAKKKEPMKVFCFVTADCFLATTTRGEVQIGRVESPDSGERYVVREVLFFEQDLCSYSILSSIPHSGVALIGNDKGLIRVYRHDLKSVSKVAEIGQRPKLLCALDYHRKTSDSPEKISFFTAYADLDTADLFIVSFGEDSEPVVERITLHLPSTFAVSCASLISDNQCLALASRFGRLAVYRLAKTDSLQPALVTDKLHSKEGITRIQSFSSLLQEPGASSDLFLTCGRDGFYRVNKLETLEGSGQPLGLRAIHFSPTTLHFPIYGAYIDAVSKDLMFYGFGGMELILWNDSLQSEVARIYCGGCHRNWAFHPSNERPGDALFVWGQGGFNAFYIQANSTRLLRAGVHGREIKSTGSFNPTDGRAPLVVTGSEDTTLRIFTPDYPPTKGPCGTLKCERVLVKHDTSPQHITWSNSGEFMFTSGGFEDFLVWRIQSIPSFGLTAGLEAASPKSDPKSEIRITSFDILEVDESQAKPGFLVCLAYSNSKLRIFHYSPTAQDDGFTLLASGTYTSNCLTQARFLLSESSLSLITTSTDGYFTLWNLTPVLEPFYVLSPTLHLRQPFDTKPIDPEKIACESRYQIHSNSIKALELVRLSGTLILVLAGGDDNAITLSLLNTESESNGYTGTITIPDAHAASVNSLKIVEQRASPNQDKIQITIATSGNDHQIKIWQIDIDAADSSLEGIQVQNMLNRYCSMADISSLEIIRDKQVIKLLACGVGMEVFKVNLP